MKREGSSLKLKIFLLFIFMFSFGFSPKSKLHAMDAKGRAFLLMCGYGTVGGALLGFASLAFQSNPRAIAQGASLGLYAGIIFGAYVITSYQSASQKSQAPAYQDPYAPDPYGAPSTVPGGGYPQQQVPGGAGAPAPDDGGFFGPPSRAIELHHNLDGFKQKHRGLNTPVFQIQLFQAQF